MGIAALDADGRRARDKQDDDNFATSEDTLEDVIGELEGRGDERARASEQRGRRRAALAMPALVESLVGWDSAVPFDSKGGQILMLVSS